MFSNVGELLERIMEEGMEEHAALILESARPCVTIRSMRVRQEALGALDARIGGDPHLPAGFEWPVWRNGPLVHLATIRLSEVSPHDAGSELPARGLLYFWYDQFEQPYGMSPSDRGGACVTFVADEDIPLVRRSHPEPGRLPLESPSGGRSILLPCRLDFAAGVTIPTLDWLKQFDPRVVGVLDEDRYFNLFDYGEETRYLLGHSLPVQNLMEPVCEEVAVAIDGGTPMVESRFNPATVAASRRWRLLLQLPSDELGSGAMWGDTGSLFFWIPRARLEASDFSSTWTILQWG